MIVAGIGLRRGATAQDIVALVRTAARKADLPLQRLSALATVANRADEPGFVAAAALLDVPRIPVAASEMRRSAGGVRTHSARIEALYGVGSVAEASALAAAGHGAHLLQSRIESPGVTCALAEGETP